MSHISHSLYVLYNAFLRYLRRPIFIRYYSNNRNCSNIVENSIDLHNLTLSDILNIAKCSNNNLYFDYNSLESISNAILSDVKKWSIVDLSNLTTALARRFLSKQNNIHQDNPLYNLYNLIYSQLLVNVNDLSLADLAKIAETLRLFNKLPTEISRILTDKLFKTLISNCTTLNTYTLSNLLWSIDSHVATKFLNVLADKLSNAHHLAAKLPETWIVYMRFIAKHRYHSKQFLLDMAKKVIICFKTNKNLSYRYNEMIPTIAWAFAIIFPLRASTQLQFNVNEISIINNLYTTLINAYLEDDIKSYVLNGGIVRLAWSLSVQDLLGKYSGFLATIQPNLSNQLRDIRHATMLYYSLRYLEIKYPKLLNSLLPIYEQCTNILQNTPRIKSIQSSKSQQFVSEALSSWKIPHTFEYTTPKLISIDISIESSLYGEKIAIEVDGPWHFLTFQNPGEQVRTGPSFFKHWLLESEEWKVISLEPSSIHYAEDLSEESRYNLHKIQKEEYRKVLLASGSKYLSLLL